MAAKPPPCVIGVDVGGTNTDAVYLHNENVVAFHKTPTTPDIQSGVETAIDAIITKANIPWDHVDSVKIGTTQFVNAVLEQDSSKLDKVAVIRLCGPYSQGSPPFVGFPKTLRKLMEGYYGYVDGGYQVDGREIMPLDVQKLKDQAAIIKSKNIKSIVVIGIYSPSNPTQEKKARKILSDELGHGFDISCSSAIGRLGFLERENASILNASLRRFARHVIAGLSYAIQKLGSCKLYITLNDGTLSKASTAAQYPVRCFRSGPTNSARGAALLAKSLTTSEIDDREILVADIGGTTTDICALLKTGYPRQSAAFVKIAGVRTNFTIPDVLSIALGGGSIIRAGDQISVGPDSLGARLAIESLAYGGSIMTANDLVHASNTSLVPQEIRISGLAEISRALEEAIDIVKTKQGDAKLILVGGGSIIIGDKISGVGDIIRPKYLEVANAVGAAVRAVLSQLSTVIPTEDRTIMQEVEDAKVVAIERCIAAGGDRETVEIVEVDIIPVSYTMNGAADIFVRVVGELVNNKDAPPDSPEDLLEGEIFFKENLFPASGNISKVEEATLEATNGISYDVALRTDLNTYRPRIEGDLWYLSELDIQFLSDGTGVLGVGSCGEPYPTFLALREIVRNGEDLTIRRQDTLPNDAVVLVCGFMGAPSVYTERLPGLNEITNAMRAVMEHTKLSNFDACIPNEIGGLNAFEALLAAHRFKKSALDTDCVARAYPMIYHTVRCLNGVSVTPAALANGAGPAQIFTVSDMYEAEEQMRHASVTLGSLGGVCVNPVSGVEAKTLPPNSFSHAWSIGRSIAIARSLKQDPITSLLEEQNGILLFTGKIISVTRDVTKGFTRGNVTLASFSEKDATELYVEFENENLSAVLKNGDEKKVLAVCPDLIQFLDIANGAPLGVTDYKYGLRVSVIALRSPPQWLTEKGLQMGGPRAFGIDMDYAGVSTVNYRPPKSVWELFGESSM
ncbi:hypothetical protein B0O99DRAFT_652008 [Bisporella sp. PMI_857]|nr:hypothetical protein B0O99DRAFT_652008 [Bisporella sp. PMI_857]